MVDEFETKKILDAQRLEQDILLHMWAHIADVDCEKCCEIMETWKSYIKEYKKDG